MKARSIDTYLPREGTETNTSYEELTMLEYSPLSTSRGAGKHQIFIILAKIINGIATYLPREGPETHQTCD